MNARLVLCVLIAGCNRNPAAHSKAAESVASTTPPPAPSDGAWPQVSAAATDAAPTGSASPTVAAGGGASAASAAASLPAYAPIEKPLSEPCGDPRAVLAVRPNGDRSARYAVQGVVMANPEFKIVPEKARAPLEVDFYETIYGTKNFARKYPGDPMFSEAVIARCADVETCNRIAATFHAAFPAERVELACGVPPKTTGGFARVAELAPERLKVPTAASPLPAHCARAVACLAREQSTLRLKSNCVGVKADALKACAERGACNDVVTCIAEELR